MERGIGARPKDRAGREPLVIPGFLLVALRWSVYAVVFPVAIGCFCVCWLFDREAGDIDAK